VTALFCDVTGSTALGESVDPEAVRAVLARYFDLAVFAGRFVTVGNALRYSGVQEA
jgi:hypothetical protein